MASTSKRTRGTAALFLTELANALRTRAEMIGKAETSFNCRHPAPRSKLRAASHSRGVSVERMPRDEARRLLALALLLAWFAPAQALADTWNEPWQREVISTAESLARFRAKAETRNGFEVTLEKHLAGYKTPNELEVSGFWLLPPRSNGRDEWRPQLELGRVAYLLLKRDAKGVWKLATPTAGMDTLLPDGDVAATYRHSTSKAAIPVSTYEATQSCIFRVLHGGRCGEAGVAEFIDQQLAKPVAVLGPDVSEEETTRFFLQHAALETAALIGHPVDDATLARFLSSEFFQVQASAVMYLAAPATVDSARRLADFVCSTGGTSFAKSVAILMLDRADARSQVAALEACAGELSDEETSLVEAIMDPRIATRFPGSPRGGLQTLLDRWASP
jgi:hypothetical protein